MARGGYQKPSEPASRSGVGKNSKRTDGRVQPNRAPNIQDSTDLQQGERRVIEAGQRVAPLSRVPTPRVQAPAPGPSPATGGGGGPAQLPPHLFGAGSTRPDEPITEGLPFGPGAGPDALTPPPPQDNRELMLNFLATTLGNEDVAQMLVDYRNERTQPDAPPMVAEASPVDVPVEDEEVGMEDELALPEDVATEDEALEEEPPVETPEAPAEEVPVV